MLVSLACPAQSESQPLPCGADQATQQLYAKFPGLEEQAAANHARMLEEGKRNLEDNRSATPPTYIIPVVFHIIHDYGTENISDAQVMDAVAILNEDFRLLNADASQIVAPFDTLAADAEIEFRLAQLDPNGNCTNGIERIQSMETYNGLDDCKLNQWPRDQYLNIWIVTNITTNAAGWAYSPSTVASPQQAHKDGVVMRHDYTGTIGTSSPTLRHLLTHEVGHWLNLRHLGGINVCADGDGIADTPVTMAWSQCQLTNNDVCNPGTPENVQNFMEYTWCLRMFTPGQVNAMHMALNSSISSRNNLWTTANLNLTGVLNTPATCIPTADFDVNRRMICEGSSVTFTDVSSNASVTTRQWILNGPATFSSTVQSPTFTNVNPAGWYDVTFIATNSAGSDTITKTNYLLVSSDTAMFNATYSETFTNLQVLPQWFIVNDRYGNGSIFSQSPNVGHSDTGGVWLNEFGNCVQGDIDEMITPSYFLSYNTNLQLQFYYAYAEDDAMSSAGQRLRVYTSIDCGQTWIIRWNRFDAALPTVPQSTVAFYPESHLDWDTVTVTLPMSAAAPNVRFKFEFTSPYDGGANNLFIDNINILSTNVGVDENENTSSFTIYPNPGDGNGTIAYMLTESADVQCNIYDVSGRLISAVDQGYQAAGNYAVEMNEELTAGIYFIEMKIGEEVSVQRYDVAE